MTKAEEFDKARRLAYKSDFSLVEKLYHPVVNTSIIELDWKSI